MRLVIQARLLCACLIFDFVSKAIEVSSTTDIAGAQVLFFLIATLDELVGHTDHRGLWLVSQPFKTQLLLKHVIEVAQTHGIPEIGLNIEPVPTLRSLAQVEEAARSFGLLGRPMTGANHQGAATEGKGLYHSIGRALAIALRNRFCAGRASNERDHLKGHSQVVIDDGPTVYMEVSMDIRRRRVHVIVVPSGAGRIHIVAPAARAWTPGKERRSC